MSTPMTHIHGWGADLDPARRPAVPKEKPSNVTTVRGVVPERQVPHVRIHQSIEHPDLTPVFGTTCPPRGLSGKLRDFAYTFSEGRLARWLTLILADRVDVYESLLRELGRGKVPNWPRERGWNERVKQSNPERAPKKPMLVGAGVAVVAVVAAAVLIARRTRS